jgi:flagellin-like protein
MDLKKLFDTEDRAVSPVIGVILMVAITVILAAVIGAFVLGLGDQASSSAPQATFDFAFEDGGNATIAHAGGQNIDASTIEVRVGSEVMYNGSVVNKANLTNTGWSSPIRTGDVLTISNTTASADYSGQEVRIVWTNPNGGSSNIIGERTWLN